MIDQTLTALEARLAVAEARLAIMDLEAEYARSWDAGDGAAWAALFTADGVFDMAAVGDRQRIVYTGTHELTTFCRDTDSFYRGLHFLHLPRLKIDGGTAYGRLHFQWIGLFNPNASFSGQRHAAGYYDVVYRCVDGQWRIQRRLEKAVTGQTQESFDVYVDADFGPEP